MIMLNEHRSHKSFRIGELEDRTYFSPFTDKAVSTKERKNLPLFINLNDKREISYYDTLNKLGTSLIACGLNQLPENMRISVGEQIDRSKALG